jgi:SAM-dependent methyltransferase
MQRQGGAAAFSETADAYQQTMALALAPVAAEVVRRAALRPGERVIDVGSGTGNAAALAVGEGRTVIGLDAAPGMLAIARERVPAAEFVEADFTALPLDDEHADVTLACHALLFAEDRVAALREWRRVTCRGGRISLSVPGPGDAVPSTVLGGVYDAYGIEWGDDYPTADDLAGWATAAGWAAPDVAADPTMAIPLPDDAAFRTWLRVGARNRLTASWAPERREAFTRDLMAAAPRDERGGYRLPFGAIYLTATRENGAS